MKTKAYRVWGIFRGLEVQPEVHELDERVPPEEIEELLRMMGGLDKVTRFVEIPKEKKYFDRSRDT